MRQAFGVSVHNGTAVRLRRGESLSMVSSLARAAGERQRCWRTEMGRVDSVITEPGRLAAAEFRQFCEFVLHGDAVQSHRLEDRVKGAKAWCSSK